MVKKAMIERHAEPRETEQATCTICMESNATVKIQCLHKFCLKCITQWSKKNLTCPLCRKTYRIAKNGCRRLALYKLKVEPRQLDPLPVNLSPRRRVQNNQQNRVQPQPQPRSQARPILINPPQFMPVGVPQPIYPWNYYCFLTPFNNFYGYTHQYPLCWRTFYA